MSGPHPERRPTARANFLASAILIAVVGLAVLVAVVALAHRVALIPVHVSWNYNEGWNAYHAMRLMTGGPLYLPRTSFLTNNYPPLSFYAVGAVGQLVGDHIIAGRLISLLSLLVVVANVYLIARGSGTSRLAAATGSLVLLGYVSVHVPAYIATNDPQWLAHAVMTSALALVVRTRPSWRQLVLVAVLMAVAGFIKHNLIALPVALLLWLLGRDRKAAFGLGGSLAASVALFFLAAGARYGPEFFLSMFATPRLFSAWRLVDSWDEWIGPMLVLIVLAAVVVVVEGWAKWTSLYALYAAASLFAVVLLAPGEGVAQNVVFDGVIALSILAAQAVDGLPRRLGMGSEGRTLATLVVIAIALSSFLYKTPGVLARAVVVVIRGTGQAETAADIEFLRRAPGEVACETLALCYWANRAQQLDMFTVGQKILTGVLTVDDLMDHLRRQKVSVIQFEEEGAWTPIRLPGEVRTRIRDEYDVARVSGRAGTFLVRRPPGPSTDPARQSGR